MLRLTFCTAVLTLAWPAMAKGRVLVQPFSGPGARDARAQLKYSLCDIAECVESSELAAGVVAGQITGPKRARKIQLQVFTERDKPAFRKTYPLRAGKLTAAVAEEAAQEISQSLPVSKSLARKKSRTAHASIGGPQLIARR